MESFRKNYAAVMERAGASLDSIDAHQGPGKSRHPSPPGKNLRGAYRAVKLMRQYMWVFDGESKTPLRLVK